MGNFHTSSRWQKITAGKIKYQQWVWCLVTSLKFHGAVMEAALKSVCVNLTTVAHTQNPKVQQQAARGEGRKVQTSSERRTQLFKSGSNAFQFSVPVAGLRTLISDLHNFPWRDFTSSLGQGETHSGWRSCWGEATPMLGRDGSSIVIAPFIPGAMMSCTRLRFLLPVAWAQHQLIPHRAAPSAAGSDKNLAATILLSARLIDLYRFKHQSVSNQPVFQFVPTRFCFATSSNRDQTWSNLYTEFLQMLSTRLVKDYGTYLLLVNGIYLTVVFTLVEM